MTSAESLFSLRLALITTILETRIATTAGGRVTEASESLRAATRAQIVSIKASNADVPGTWLETRLGLTATEEDVLWLLVACESSPPVRALIASITGSTQLTVSSLTEIIYGTSTSLVAHRELSRAGTLQRLELVQRTDSGDQATPDFEQTLRAHPRVRALCLGDDRVGDELEGLAAPSTRTESAASIVVSSGALERARESAKRAGQLVLAVGRRGTGRASLLDAVARENGNRVLVVEAARLPAERERLSVQLRRIARESRLLGMDVLVRDLEAIPSELLDVVDAELLRNLTAQCFATATVRPSRTRWSRPLAVVELGSLSGAQREALWKRAIPSAAESDGSYLASTYPFAPATINAVGKALDACTSGRPTADQVTSCIDAVVDEQLGALADRVVTSQTWDDVVLPDDQFDVVEAIVARVRQRTAVYEQWGFAAKLGKGLGVTALMSGPPGTGKTMTAGLIAKDLGLPMYQVDLSKVVSKWIGETEKHLGALFDAAEAGHAVLLFDEADSLFGKRTDVKSSNDRHANLEVNYLLQRIERFTGICFLTTNHESAVDEAFRRRLAFHLRFPLPEEAERVELWRRLLPETAPVSKDIDFASLGRRLAMSGGYIRNAVLRAAFAACDEGSPISMAHLWNAGVAEYEAMGKIASGLC